MGQRDGFRMSDIAKINAMYNCGTVPSGPPSNYNTGSSNYNPATYPSRPTGQYTHPVASAISGFASILQQLG